LAEQSSTRQHLPAGALSSRGLVLAAAMMAIVLTATEGSIVATAMPTIVAHLRRLSPVQLGICRLSPAQAVSIPIYGRLADLYGRKPVFFVGTSPVSWGFYRLEERARVQGYLSGVLGPSRTGGG
jgi:MFS family permease